MPIKKVIKKKKIVVSKETSRLAGARSKNNTVRAKSRTTTLSVPVYSLAGRASGTMSLPKEIFGQKINERSSSSSKTLLAQALRVYMTNQNEHRGSTKTRGEVRGSTAKIYRQKGTGRARHGSIRAPIFVGGGIVFGPRPRKVRLELPRAMKKAALFSALSEKAGDQGLLGVSGLEKAAGKTKEMAKFVKKIREMREIKGSILIVTAEKQDNVVRGVRNIPGVDVMPASLINAYEVLKHEILLITKDSLVLLSKDKKEEQV